MEFNKCPITLKISQVNLYILKKSAYSQLPDWKSVSCFSSNA